MKSKYLIIPLLFSILFSCGSGNTNSNPISENISVESENLDSLPEISTLEKTYFNFDSYDNYKITLGDIDSIAVLHYDGKVIDTKLYIFNDQTHELIISNNYMVEKGFGKHILSINRDTHYCVVVYDAREPKLLSSPTFKYLGQKNPTFKFSLFGAEPTKLIFNEEEYNQYIKAVDDNTLTIDAVFCELILPAGSNNIKVILEQDLPTELKVFEFNLVIITPSLGEIVPGTTVSSETQISDYFTHSEGVINPPSGY